MASGSSFRLLASQGLDGFDGVLWYRRNVRVPVAQDSEIGGLAIRVEALAYGSYQLFLDGVLVGSYGSDANSLPFPKPQLFSVPEGVLDDGHMILALRVERVAWAADAADPSGSVVASVFLGPHTLLEVEMESKRRDRLLADLGVLLFTVYRTLPPISLQGSSGPTIVPLVRADGDLFRCERHLLLRVGSASL